MVTDQEINDVLELLSAGNADGGRGTERLAQKTIARIMGKYSPERISEIQASPEFVKWNAEHRGKSGFLSGLAGGIGSFVAQPGMGDLMLPALAAGYMYNPAAFGAQGAAAGATAAAGGTTGDIAAMLQQMNPALTSAEAMAAAEAYSTAGFTASTLGPAITQQTMLNAAGLAGTTGNAALDTQLASAVQNGTLPASGANSYIQAINAGTITPESVSQGLTQSTGSAGISGGATVPNTTTAGAAGANNVIGTTGTGMAAGDVAGAGAGAGALSSLAGAGISAGASLLGADMAAESAKEAARLQTELAREGIGGMNTALAEGRGVQQAQFDRGNTLMTDNFNQAATDMGTQYQQGQNRFDTQYEAGQNLQRPWYESGAKALTSLNDLMGLGENGPEGQLAALMSAPGYKFRLQQGQKGLDAGIAAKGGMGSGKSAVAASQYNQNFASNEYGNRLAQLSSVSNTGLQTGTNMANQGMDYAKTSAGHGTNYANTLSNLRMGYAGGMADRGTNFANNFAAQGNQTAAGNANLLSGLGNAQGAAAIAQGNAWQSGLLGAGQAASDYMNPPKTGGKWVNGVWVPA